MCRSRGLQAEDKEKNDLLVERLMAWVSGIPQCASPHCFTGVSARREYPSASFRIKGGPRESDSGGGVGRYGTHRTSVMDEPSTSKLGNLHARKTNRRSVEGCCHCPFAYYPHAPVGDSAGWKVFRNAVQLHGSNCRGPTRKPTSRHRKSHTRLRTVDFAVPLGHGDAVQRYSTATDPSRFRPRRRVPASLWTHAFSSHPRIRAVQ